MKFFLDEGVPASVGKFLHSEGHDVILLKDVIATGSPDNVVATAAEKNEAILVACDGDMKQMVKRFGIGAGRFKALNLLKITCAGPLNTPRVQQSLSLVQHEWDWSQRKKARRMFVEIKSDVIRTYR